MIAEGYYKARATGPFMQGESSKQGTPMVVMTFRIEEDGPFKSAMIDWEGYLTEKTEARTVETLVLCGWDKSDPATVTRNEVVLVIEHEENEYTDAQGTQRKHKKARIKYVNDPARSGSARSKPMDAAKAAVFMDRMKALAIQQEAAKPAKQDTSFEFGANANAQSPTPAPGAAKF